MELRISEKSMGSGLLILIISSGRDPVHGLPLRIEYPGAYSGTNAGLWGYGVALSTAAGFLNPVTGTILTGALAYWSMSELLKSLDLLNKGYNQLDDPCKCK